MTHDIPGGTLSALLSLDRLARSHGCGGLSPALVAALTADMRSSSRVSLPVQTTGAGDDRGATILTLDDFRATKG